jgi:hypothetical protein
MAVLMLMVGGLYALGAPAIWLLIANILLGVEQRQKSDATSPSFGGGERAGCPFDQRRTVGLTGRARRLSCYPVCDQRHQPISRSVARVLVAWRVACGMEWCTIAAALWRTPTGVNASDKRTRRDSSRKSLVRGQNTHQGEIR